MLCILGNLNPRQLPGSKFKLKVLYEEISDMSQDSEANSRISKNKAVKGKELNKASPSLTKRLRIKRKSFVSATMDSHPTKKSVYLAKRVSIKDLKTIQQLQADIEQNFTDKQIANMKSQK